MADSFKASQAGLEQIDLERRKKGWTKQSPAWIDAANESLSSEDAISVSTLKRFWAKEQIRQKGFAAICKAVGVDDWQTIADLPTSPQPAEPEAIDPPDINNLVQEMRDRCCAYISAEYSKIELVNHKQVDVSQLHIDVYVLEECSRDSRATISGLLKDRDWYKDFDRLGLGQRKERIFGLQIAKQEPKLIVFGKPGSGKSTFLKQIAMACCGMEMLADYIPILFELRSIEDPTQFNLLNVVYQQLELADQEKTKQILNCGKVLFLLDGLDEVNNQAQRKVQEHIYQFSKHPHYYRNRFVLTCRTQTTEYIGSNYRCVEIDDFNPEQIKRFAYKWFQVSVGEYWQAERLAEHFLAQLQSPENKQTADLAVTPILLSLTCWVFEKLKELPSQRAKLYAEALDLLLKKSDERKGIQRDSHNEIYRRMTVAQKKDLLSYIAMRKFEQKQYVLFEQDEIQKYIAEYLNISTEDAEEVLKSIEAQHGLLVERARGIYSFSHLTFHEYFTAQEFANICDPQKLEQALQTLVNHITEKRYREVFLLTVEMLPSADYLLRLMKFQTDALSAGHTELQQFLGWLKEKPATANASYRPLIARIDYLALTANLTLILSIARLLASEHDLASERDCALNPNLSDRERDLECFLAESMEHLLDHTLVIAGSLDLYLQEDLQQLKEQLSDSIYPRRDNFEQWWQAKGQFWTERLETVMIEYRVIGRAWNLDEEKRGLLQQYYDANKLLIDCLNSDCRISPEVRQEIEETLLLPIAEIEA